MSPRKLAASKGRDDLVDKVKEINSMIKSAKFEAFVKKLDDSLADQQIAIKDVDASLKENGIIVPKGVSFSFKPGSSKGPLGHLQMTIDIPLQKPDVISKRTV